MMVAFSVAGYCVIGSCEIDRKPSTRISRLTTADSTGRSTNRSVNFIASPSLLLGSRVRIVFGHHGVVDEELRPVLQLELPAGHHRVTLFDAAQDRRLVAPCPADSDKHLLRDQRLPSSDLFARNTVAPYGL